VIEVDIAGRRPPKGGRRRRIPHCCDGYWESIASLREAAGISRMAAGGEIHTTDMKIGRLEVGGAGSPEPMSVRS